MRKDPPPFVYYWRGLRVPLVAAYYSEKGRVAFCPYVGREALFTGSLFRLTPEQADALGKPFFGAMSAQRQRMCMALGLCQVCGVAIQSGEGYQLGELRPRGPDKLVAYDEPLVCMGCAVEALRSCPHLLKHSERNIYPMPTAYRLAIQQVVPDRSEVSRRDFRAAQKAGGVAAHLRMVIDAANWGLPVTLETIAEQVKSLPPYDSTDSLSPNYSPLRAAEKHARNYDGPGAA